MVCGGYDGTNDLSSCYNIATGTTISLDNQRAELTSWRTDDNGLYLIGGYPNPSTNSKTTELITGETTQEGFELKYETRYVS